MAKDVFSLTEEELKDIAVNKDKAHDAEIIRRILSDGIKEMRYEVERLERFIENFTIRGGALMTIAGLISLLPYTVIVNGEVFLRHFLIWTFPFLAFAIWAFIKSSKRKHTYRVQFASVAPGAPEELIALRLEALSVRDMWEETYKSHKQSLKWHRLNSISTLLFLFSYIFNFYLFIFYKLSSVRLVTVFSLILLILGIVLYRRNLSESGQKGYREVAVGGIPNEGDIP